MTLREALKASEEKLEREGEVERSRLRMMRNYAEHSGCRRSFLLTYFGQDYQGPVLSNPVNGEIPVLSRWPTLSRSKTTRAR